MTSHELKHLADIEMSHGRRQNAEFLLEMAVEKLQAENAWLDAQLADLGAEREQAEREAICFGLVMP